MTTRKSRLLDVRVRLLPSNERLKKLIKMYGDIWYAKNLYVRLTQFHDECARQLRCEVFGKNGKVRKVTTEVRIEHAVPLEVL